MKSNYLKYVFEKSLERVDNILYDETSYDEADDIPEIDNLTFKNGKYVKCAALFIDLRGSTDLIEKQRKQSRSLARLYRTYISEVVAIINSFETCKEINIVGDCVSAIFSGRTETSNTPVIESLQASSMLNGMMKVLNVKYRKKWSNFEEVQAGIGLAYGRALVIKAGFSGSGINDLIYMGDVVNRASKMCGLAYKTYSFPICVTEGVYDEAGTYIANKDKNQTFQDFLNKKEDHNHGMLYTGNFYRLSMNDWVNENV